MWRNSWELSSYPQKNQKFPRCSDWWNRQERAGSTCLSSVQVLEWTLQCWLIHRFFVDLLLPLCFYKAFNEQPWLSSHPQISCSTKQEGKSWMRRAGAKTRKVFKERMIHLAQWGINSLQQATPALFIHSLLSTGVSNLKENLRHQIALTTIQKNSMIKKSERTGLAWSLVGMQNIADAHMG